MILLSRPSKLSRSAETSKPSGVIETSGSLAMNNNGGLISHLTDSYDEFIPSNPFAVDYSSYSFNSDFDGESLAYDGGFLSDFAAAVSTLSSAMGESSFADGGFASCSSDCGCSSGGFSSVC